MRCEIATIYAALRHLHIVHRWHRIAQKSANPVRTAPKFRHSRALLRFQKSLHRELQTTPSSANPGKPTSKTFANLLSTKYPNSFSRKHERPPSFRVCDTNVRDPGFAFFGACNRAYMIRSAHRRVLSCPICQMSPTQSLPWRARKRPCCGRFPSWTTSGPVPSPRPRGAVATPVAIAIAPKIPGTDLIFV